jgi:catechol 2,3-dioxygenase-like lactoylglutathione lyase family enzyme
MFSGAHVILFSADPEADRRFLDETLGFPNVDAGAGWLIFKLPPAEMAVHPSDGESRHELYLMCDDIRTLLTELEHEGVVISAPLREERWGFIAQIRLPGGSELAIYEPKHPVAHTLG